MSSTYIQLISPRTPCRQHIYNSNHHGRHVVNIYTTHITTDAMSSTLYTTHITTDAMSSTYIQLKSPRTPCHQHIYNSYHHGRHVVNIYTTHITTDAMSSTLYTTHITTDAMSSTYIQLKSSRTPCHQHIYNSYHHGRHVVNIYTTHITTDAMSSTLYTTHITTDAMSSTYIQLKSPRTPCRQHIYNSYHHGRHVVNIYTTQIITDAMSSTYIQLISPRTPCRQHIYNSNHHGRHVVNIYTTQIITDAMSSTYIQLISPRTPCRQHIYNSYHHGRHVVNIMHITCRQHYNIQFSSSLLSCRQHIIYNSLVSSVVLHTVTRFAKVTMSSVTTNW